MKMGKEMARDQPIIIEDTENQVELLTNDPCACVSNLYS
jgi:hypothetical protein